MAEPETDLTPDDLERARSLVARDVHRTPLLSSRTLSAMVGAPVHLKCENLQRTGSFKVRGALHRLLRLSEDERARGVSTISAGNHAQAVAWAASTLGVPSLVVMPEHASPAKVRASRAYGAEVVLHGDARAAFERVRVLSDERGLTFVHPFDDREVVAGHASCGLEILDALPGARTVVVPVGGGGLCSGIAVAARARGSDAAVWGVEPEGAAAMRRSLDAGHAVHLDAVDTVADGLAAPMAGALNHRILAAHAAGVALVQDREILRALSLLLERAKLLVEPAGAAGLAALLAERIPIDRGAPVVVVLSGGNVDLDRLGALLDAGRPDAPAGAAGRPEARSSAASRSGRGARG